MADLVKTFTIPEEQVSELIDVFGKNYPERIEDPDNEGQTIPNPETKAQFANSIFETEIKNYVKRRVFAYRKEQARLAVENDFMIN